MTTPSPYAPEPGAPVPAAVPAPSAAAGQGVTAAPVTPVAPMVPAAPATTDTAAVALTGILAVVFLVAGVTNQVALISFPSNAPVEQIYAFGITVDLIAGGIALIVRFLLIFRRPRLAAVPHNTPGGLAITAGILGLVTAVGWLLLGGAPFLGKLVGVGDGLRYYLDVSGAFFLGGPWIVGLVFGVVAFRRGRETLHLVLSLGAIAVAVLVLVASLYSSIAYGSGLTD